MAQRGVNWGQMSVTLAFIVISDDGLDHRKLLREDQAGIESVDSRKLPRDGIIDLYEDSGCKSTRPACIIV